jgi:signal transduction histidine kinase
LTQEIEEQKFRDGTDNKYGYRKTIRENEKVYYYQLEDVKTNKPGKYQIKIIHDAFKKYFYFMSDVMSIEEAIKDIAIHNTRNIHTSIIERLKITLEHEKLIHAEDKIKYIRDIVEKKPMDVTKDLLSILKSSEQITFDYDIIDFISIKRPLEEADFTDQKLHTSLVLAFYIFERDFEKNRIHVNIDRTHLEIRINFYTFRSALALLFENCVKYCKPGTDIDIDYNYTTEYLKIDIAMHSVLNEEKEIENIFLPGFRGEQANKIKNQSGKGYGLYAAQQLLLLNGISLDFKTIDRNSTTILNGITYCNNLFIIDIPINKVKTT